MGIKGSLNSIYNLCLPFYIIPFDLTQAKSFHQNYQFLKESESWSQTRIQEWQFQKIKAVIEHAADSVPYYQKLFKRIGFEAGDFKSLEVLKQLPVTSKQDIKNNFSEFISTNFKKKDMYKDHTGGSTGSPLVFYTDREKAEIELSFFYYIWEKHGYKIGERCVFLKGDKLANASKTRFHRFDNVLNYLRFDSGYLSKSEYLKYFDEPIRKFDAKVIFGYPSSLFQFAKCYARARIAPPQFDLILMASENVYDDQLEFIKDVFRAKDIFFHYGQAEKVLLAFKHFNNNYLGFVPQYGYFELLNAEKRSVEQEDEIGEIIGTGYSKCMPFIRYRTYDYAKYANYQSQDFMQAYPTVKTIEGRLHEYIISKDKRLVSNCVIGSAHLKMIPNIIEIQYYQEKEGELVLKVIQSPEEPLTDRQIIDTQNKLEQELDHKFDVRIQVVEQIAKTVLNKKIIVDQKLNIEDYIN